MVVQLSILVGNVADLLALGYTRIEVWQSRDDGNLYEEITAGAAQAARLESVEASNSFRLGGKLLKLSVDGAAEQSISFSALTEYWSPTQVANRINEVIPGLASVSGSKVVLTSPTTGRTSSIRVTYSDGIDLGWTDQPEVLGKDVRITLVGGTLSYTYTDLAGRDSYRYKWRFSGNGAAPISDFSEYVLGSAPPVLPSNQLSVCTVSFVGLDGRPQKRRVIVASLQDPSSISGKMVFDRTPKVFDSDDSGYLQFTLVRGLKVRVAIEGTSFVREFTVPNAASFDLLQAMTDAPDPYSVQTSPPFLIRRSI
jgi:hypothetical protein